MVNINFRHHDDVFCDMEKELKKFANIMPFSSLEEYEQALRGMSCDQLKNSPPENTRVPGAEVFEKVKVYKKVLAEKGCVQSANDKVAVNFAIQYITKIADELDKHGFVEIANVLDQELKKFAMLICEDCK